MDGAAVESGHNPDLRRTGLTSTRSVLRDDLWERLSMNRATRLPARFPANTKYVLEARGRYVYRHIEYPNGDIVELSPRMAASCDCADQTLVPTIRASADARRRKLRAEATL